MSAAIFAAPQQECRHAVITGVELGRPANWQCPSFCDGRVTHYADTHGVVMTP